MRARRSIRARLALLWLGGCVLSTQAGAERSTLRFDIAGQERRVRVYAPASATQQPTPLIVVYHGRGDDYTPFARAVKLHEDWPEAIVAYPRGEMHAHLPMRGWQYRKGQYADRDLMLTDRLLTELAQRYQTHPQQTFAAGFSNGGHFVFLLMTERPQAFAAHAVLGVVRPEFAAEVPAKPLMYLFGRGEPAEYQSEWQGTVEALVSHQRGRGQLEDVLDCCKLQRPAEDGAPLVLGVYNAGHTWPLGGNRWLKAFFSDPWFAAPPQSRPGSD